MSCHREQRGLSGRFFFLLPQKNLRQKRGNKERRKKRGKETGEPGSRERHTVSRNYLNYNRYACRKVRLLGKRGTREKGW